MDSWIQPVVGAGSPAKRPALLANPHPPFTVAAAQYSRVNPLLPRGGQLDTARRRSGFTAKRPALLANLHPPFTVAAATVFAGKPAPTTGVDSWIQPVVGAGSPAKRPAC
ncbi:hypothetical protein PRJ_1640 [Pseudomonas sp. XWY-1]|nr:hypothetical protein PRJ_1640 [Pseudomonas sp. XWY-1]